ncbi:hypothetical protein [Methylibium petroleiphilum]|uniref:Uncharacterized protein n=1 Tax=Methylibium petroleiphilum (strain ATCC BAA-1232 / LMG 22953 / PM1) TaxID=420662 RepID=A2SNF0_METPP|nr:hypothetical protein [Methylibium petroleiphilum]ABM97089.1 hypothetical protein Mpe_B0314 [Methylibium petroleiphilum PM1]
MSNIEQEALRLDHPAYHAEPRRGWGGYTRRVSVMSTMDPAGGRRLLRRYMPGLTAEQHRSIARGHVELALKHRQGWSDTADEAAQATFGRNFGIHDYKVSAIGRDEFSEAHKERLRQHAYSKGDHHRLAVLHFMAAGHRHQTALGFCRESGL